MRTALYSGLVAGMALLGCHDVWSTGPYGIRGRLLDGNGQPLALKKVVSEEHGAMTENDGSFNVRWKDPATFVDIRHEGVTWRRRWLGPQDQGDVEVRLPHTSAGTVTCRSDVECVAEVIWDFGQGLTARMDVECGDTASVKIQGLPPGKPTSIRCPTVLGDRPMTVERTNTTLTIAGRPLPLPLTIEGTVERSECDVRILDGEVARDRGGWGLRPERDTHAWALCSGRPGTPVAVEPRKRGLRDEAVMVRLPWTEQAPSLTLPEPVPEPRTLRLSRRSVDGTGWTLTIEPTAQDLGTYLLPPLPRGQYLLGLGSPALFAATNPPDPEVPGQVIFLREPGTWGEQGGMVGALSLEEDLGEGEVKATVQQARPDEAD